MVSQRWFANVPVCKMAGGTGRNSELVTSKERVGVAQAEGQVTVATKLSDRSAPERYGTGVLNRGAEGGGQL